MSKHHWGAGPRPAYVEYQGRVFALEWAIDAAGFSKARDAFVDESVDRGARARCTVLFKRLADDGRIESREHFKALNNKGDGLFEFKVYQLRVIGTFVDGVFIIGGVFVKKGDWGKRHDSDLERCKTAIRTHLRVTRGEHEK
jgi:hypothetical protein